MWKLYRGILANFFLFLLSSQLFLKDHVLRYELLFLHTLYSYKNNVDWNLIANVHKNKKKDEANRGPRIRLARVY